MLRSACLVALGLVLALPHLAAAQTGTRARPLVLAAGPEGSAEQAVAAALAPLVQQRLGLNTRVQATDGSLENIQLLETNGAQLALVALPTARAAVAGTLPAEPGHRYGQLRILLPLYVEPLVFVARSDSPIGALQDLDDRVLGIGPFGGSLAATMPRLARQIGLTGRLRSGDSDDLAAQLQSRHLDATVWMQPLPSDTLNALPGMRVFGLSVGEIQLLLDGVPGIAAVHVSPDDLPARHGALNTVGLWMALAVRADMSDDTVQRLYDLLLDNPNRLGDFVTVTADNATANTAAPFHDAMPLLLRQSGVDAKQPAIP